ncbi:MAG: universal stress protein [Candidatus Promineifilaceae bacterium]
MPESVQHTVLVPLSSSPYSREILTAVQTFLLPQSTRLILFHVSRQPKSISAPGWKEVPEKRLEQGGAIPSLPEPIYASQQEESIRAQVAAELVAITQALEMAGYQIEVQVCFGDNVAEEIVRLVKENGIHLIAMSTHAREGVSRIVFGDIAQQILHDVHIPMLLLHPQVA